MEQNKLFTFISISLLKKVMSLYFHNNCINSASIRHKDVQDSMHLFSKEGVTASVCNIYD